MSATPEVSAVNDCDREAAAKLVEWQNGTGWEPQFFNSGLPRGMREGAWDDHPVVQAFAAHRAAAAAREQALVLRIATIEGALEPFAKCSTGSEDEVPDDTSVQAKTLYYHMSAQLIADFAERGIAIPDNRVSLIVSFDGLKIGDFRKARAVLKSDRMDGEVK